MNSNSPRLAAIEARLAKATKGPWNADGNGFYLPGMGWTETWGDANADFIAHSREDMELLLPVLKAAMNWNAANAAYLEKFGVERADALQIAKAELIRSLRPFTASDQETTHE